jgi:hypothetical protein
MINSSMSFATSMSAKALNEIVKCLAALKSNEWYVGLASHHLGTKLCNLLYNLNCLAKNDINYNKY